MRRPQNFPLYKFAADTLARTWRPAQGVSESDLVKESTLLKEDYLTPLLSKLAYWLHVNKPTGIATEREVYEVLGEEWSRLNEMYWNSDDPSPKIKEEVRKFIAAVHEHTGLFVERAPKRYGFIHLTFEEYYVARYIVARRKMVAKLIRQHLHQTRWEEPILLAVGFVGLEYPAEASELVEAAILGEGEEAKELGFTSSKYEYPLGQDFLFSLHCLGDNIPIRPRLLKRLIERFADELLNNTGSARFRRYRQNLQEKLSYFGGSEGASVILPLLVIALHSPEIDVRHSAIVSLGQMGRDTLETNVEICTVLRKANNWVLHRDSARLLNRINPDDTVSIDALWDGLLDEDNNVREACAQSLAELGKRHATLTQAFETTFIGAIQDPRYEKPGTIVGLQPFDFAYEGLWLLVVNAEVEKK